MKFLIFLSLFFMALPNAYACFGQGLSALAQGRAAEAQANQQNAKNLMDAGQKRFETAKSCRTELQKAYIDYQEKKFEHERTIRNAPNAIRKLEIKNQQAILTKKSECKETANTEFTAYRTGKYAQVTSDASTLGGYNQRVQGAWKNFFNQCIGDDIFLKQLDLLQQQLNVEIEDERNKTKDALQALARLHEQVTLIQGLIQKNCEDARALADYNEKLVQYMHSNALSAAKDSASTNAIAAVLGCFSGQGQNGKQNSNSAL